MFNPDLFRLTRKLFALVALLVCLAFAATDLGTTGARAAICCDQCFYNYDVCVDGCTTTACEQSCYDTLVNCHRYCNPDC